MLVRGVLFAALPFMVYFALQYLEPWQVGVMLLAILTLKIPGGGLAFLRARGVRLVAILAGGSALVALFWLSNDPVWVLGYPVIMNVLMLGTFGYSLWRPPTVIERLARLRHPELPAEGVRYTRRVTQVWCGFFLVNGSVAAWTATAAPREVWVLYNGLVSYLLMGLLFMGEWLYRRWRFGAGAVR